MTRSPKSSEYRTSAGAYDGAIMQVVSSGQIDIGAASANNGQVVVHSSGEIVAIRITNHVISGDDTNVLINIGTSLDDDSILKDYDLAIAAKSSQLIPLDAATVVDLTVTAGDIIEFASEASTGGTGSTSNAEVGITLVINPNG